jgi:predicted dehydrogenase
MISDVHLDAWTSVASAEVVALCDPDTRRRDEKAAVWGISRDRLFDGLETALQGESIDAVDIVTPLDTHRALAEQAAAAGKHILCQKPFAPSLQDARAILKACEENNVRVMVAEAFRWRAHYRRIKDILDNGVLGKLHFARLSAKWHFSPTWYNRSAMKQPFFRDMDRLLIQEMGPHWFDVYVHLFGDPRSVKCSYRRVSPYARGEDLAVVVFEHDSMIGLLEASWASREYLDSRFHRDDGINTMDRLVIDGADATLRLDADGKIDIIRGRSQIERIAYDPGVYVDAHKRLHNHFIDCLDTGEPFATSGEANLRVLELIETAYASGGAG